MKALRFYGPGQYELCDIPKPEISDREILLKVKAAAICGSDMRMIANGYKNVSKETPLTYGHEFAGIIEKVGKNAPGGYKVGDSVAVAPNIGCGVCDMCVAGTTHLCTEYRAFGINMDGGFAEYVRIPEQAIAQGNLTLIDPDKISYPKAAAVEPLSCAFSGFEKMDIRPCDTVLIIGSGPIGIMHAMLAKMAGAIKVIVYDINSERLDKVREYDSSVITFSGDGLKEFILSETGGRGVDVCITACPAPSAQAQSLELLAMNGRVCFFGGLPAGKDEVVLKTNLIHYKQLNVTGSARSSISQYRKCMSLVSEGIMNIDWLISGLYQLEDYEEAIATMKNGSHFKNVFVF